MYQSTSSYCDGSTYFVCQISDDNEFQNLIELGHITYEDQNQLTQNALLSESLSMLQTIDLKQLKEIFDMMKEIFMIDSQNLNQNFINKNDPQKNSEQEEIEKNIDYNTYIKQNIKKALLTNDNELIIQHLLSRISYDFIEIANICKLDELEQVAHMIQINYNMMINIPQNMMNVQKHTIKIIKQRSLLQLFIQNEYGDFKDLSINSFIQLVKYLLKIKEILNSIHSNVKIDPDGSHIMHHLSLIDIQNHMSILVDTRNNDCKCGIKEVIWRLLKQAKNNNSFLLIYKYILQKLRKKHKRLKEKLIAETEQTKQAIRQLDSLSKITQDATIENIKELHNIINQSRIKCLSRILTILKYDNQNKNTNESNQEQSQQNDDKYIIEELIKNIMAQSNFLTKLLKSFFDMWTIELYEAISDYDYFTKDLTNLLNNLPKSKII
jgi:hypothetical protein